MSHRIVAHHILPHLTTPLYISPHNTPHHRYTTPYHTTIHHTTAQHYIMSHRTKPYHTTLHDTSFALTTPYNKPQHIAPNSILLQPQHLTTIHYHPPTIPYSPRCLTINTTTKPKKCSSWTFSCLFHQTPTTDGPVPWASKDDVTFLAEQVSHHPPSKSHLTYCAMDLRFSPKTFTEYFCSTVSAFYAENRTKKISFGAHIWTKSKFLGLSIGVENVGQGK